MMLEVQKGFLVYLNKLSQVIETVGASDLTIDGEPAQTNTLKQAMIERELLVPVVGAFSAGKSSLLNAVIGNSILPMDIRPETAVPTELRYDSRERLEAFFIDGRSEQYGIEQLPALQAQAPQLKFLRLYLERPALKNLAPLVLVDMPGFNSPLDAHNKAIDRYIGDGIHYLFVVSVEEGALHQQIISSMDQINTMGRDFTVCVNKADLKPADDVQSICAYIREQLADEGFQAPVCAVSKNDPASAQAMLGSFNPGKIFSALFAAPLLGHNLAIQDILDTAVSGLESSKEANAQKIKEMEQALAALEQERQQQTKASTQDNLEQMADDILRVVHNRLAGSVDMLAQAALRSPDEMNRLISDEVRGCVISGLKNATNNLSAQMVSEFSHHLSGSLQLKVDLSSKQDGWTDSLLEVLQKQLLPDLLSGLTGKAGGSGPAMTTIATGIAAARFIPHPILQVVATVLPSVLGAILGSIGEGQKLEQAKEAIRTQVLPAVESSLRPQLVEFLLQAQEQIVLTVSKAFDERITVQKAVLEKINREAESDNLKTRIDVLDNALAQVRTLADVHLQAVRH